MSGSVCIFISILCFITGFVCRHLIGKMRKLSSNTIGAQTDTTDYQTEADRQPLLAAESKDDESVI